jgi:hypothetical protein
MPPRSWNITTQPNPRRRVAFGDLSAEKLVISVQAVSLGDDRAVDRIMAPESPRSLAA